MVCERSDVYICMSVCLSMFFVHLFVHVFSFPHVWFYQSYKGEFFQFVRTAQWAVIC